MMSNEEFKLQHPWGSSQYDAAYQIYEEVLSIAKTGGSVPGLRYTRIRDLEEARTILLADILGDPEHPVRPWEEDDFEDQKLLQEAKSAEDFFKALRDSGWDLWSAAPAIAQAFLEDMEMADPPTPDPEDAAGWPLINQLIIQNESGSTGLPCAALEFLGIIKDTSCFEDFST